MVVGGGDGDVASGLAVVGLSEELRAILQLDILGGNGDIAGVALRSAREVIGTRIRCVANISCGQHDVVERHLVAGGDRQVGTVRELVICAACPGVVAAAAPGQIRRIYEDVAGFATPGSARGESIAVQVHRFVRGKLDETAVATVAGIG